MINSSRASFFDTTGSAFPGVILKITTINTRILHPSQTSGQGTEKGGWAPGLTNYRAIFLRTVLDFLVLPHWTYRTKKPHMFAGIPEFLGMLQCSRICCWKWTSVETRSANIGPRTMIATLMMGYEKLENSSRNWIDFLVIGYSWSRNRHLKVDSNEIDPKDMEAFPSSNRSPRLDFSFKWLNLWQQKDTTPLQPKVTHIEETIQVDKIDILVDIVVCK